MIEPSTRARWRRTLVGATILLRHALGYIVGLFHLDRVVPFHHGLLGHPRRRRRIPVQSTSVSP